MATCGFQQKDFILNQVFQTESTEHMLKPRRTEPILHERWCANSVIDTFFRAILRQLIPRNSSGAPGSRGARRQPRVFHVRVRNPPTRQGMSPILLPANDNERGRNLALTRGSACHSFVLCALSVYARRNVLSFSMFRTFRSHNGRKFVEARQFVYRVRGRAQPMRNKNAEC